MANAFVFLDTNAALHFRRADEIDWLKLTHAEAVTVVITSVFLRELETQKVQNPKKRLRDRARETVIWLHTCRGQKTLRTGVDLLFLPKEPLIDFEALELDRGLYDDRLIASAIAFRSRYPNAIIWVATADLGLELKLELFGLNPLALPETLSLPEDPDPDRKELERIKRELQRLQSRMPDLRLWFADGGAGARLEIGVAELTDSEVPEPLDVVKALHPLVANGMHYPSVHLEGGLAGC
jgi:PIN domain